MEHPVEPVEVPSGHWAQARSRDDGTWFVVVAESEEALLSKGGNVMTDRIEITVGTAYVSLEALAVLESSDGRRFPKWRLADAEQALEQVKAAIASSP